MAFHLDPTVNIDLTDGISWDWMYSHTAVENVRVIEDPTLTERAEKIFSSTPKT